VSPSLLVMAAGVGSRYGGLKQLDPIGPNAELILDYSIFDALRAGVERVVFVIRPDMEAEFRAAVGGRYDGTVDVSYVLQRLDDLPESAQPPAGRTKPWGTGHAVLSARNTIRESFIVVNADDFYGPAGFVSLVSFLRAPAERARQAYALVAYRLADTLSPHGPVARGVCKVGEDGFLRGIDEHTSMEPGDRGVLARAPDGGVRRFRGDEPVSMNLWGFQPGVFDHLLRRFDRFLAGHGQDPAAEFPLPGTVFALVREGLASVRVLRSDFPWLGVTYREDRDVAVRRLSDLIRQGVYPERLWS
jgi:hypothetical protein